MNVDEISFEDISYSLRKAVRLGEENNALSIVSEYLNSKRNKKYLRSLIKDMTSEYIGPAMIYFPVFIENLIKENKYLESILYLCRAKKSTLIIQLQYAFLLPNYKWNFEEDDGMLTQLYERIRSGYNPFPTDNIEKKPLKKFLSLLKKGDMRCFYALTLYFFQNIDEEQRIIPIRLFQDKIKYTNDCINMLLQWTYEEKRMSHFYHAVLLTLMEYKDGRKGSIIKEEDLPFFIEDAEYKDTSKIKELKLVQSDLHVKNEHPDFIYPELKNMTLALTLAWDIYLREGRILESEEFDLLLKMKYMKL